MTFPRHILESQQFDRKGLEELFALADTLEGVRNTSLQGKIMASLFYEPSTRTRLSFESAMQWLGGTVISTENAKEFSSAAKGETIEDTMRMMNQYADVVVLRHFEEGACNRASQVATIPVINAGDGPGQHPTQALLDLYTIQKETGKTDGLHIAAVGDLKHGRTIRSLAYLLAQYENISLTFVSPPELAMGADILEYLRARGVLVIETEDLESVLADTDVIYMTRIQKERFADAGEYEKLKGKYVLTRAHADAMKQGSIIMHPLPRVDEIEIDVDSSEKAVYFKQAGYGLTLRMALLSKLLS